VRWRSTRSRGSDGEPTEGYEQPPTWVSIGAPRDQRPLPHEWWRRSSISGRRGSENRHERQWMRHPPVLLGDFSAKQGAVHAEPPADPCGPIPSGIGVCQNSSLGVWPPETGSLPVERDEEEEPRGRWEAWD
jgi:hypothetical protein